MAERSRQLRQAEHYIPGMRVQIRDAEWRIRKLPLLPDA